jgi:hypothetical protein
MFVLLFLTILPLANATGCAVAPDRQVPAAEAALRAELIQTALDREALFTISGGLKPLSTGFWQGRIDLSTPDVDELMRVRKALAPLRTGDLYADVQAFATPFEGARHLEAYVAHRPAVAMMIERTQPFWASYGIAPDTHPAEIVAVVDRMPSLDRFRSYGLLFGYPEDAIDFFVGAAARQQETGEFVERRFMQIPTFEAPTGRFVYAVAEDHVTTPADARLRQRAAEILERYRAVRDPDRPLDVLKKVTR